MPAVTLTMKSDVLDTACGASGIRQIVMPLIYFHLHNCFIMTVVSSFFVVPNTCIASASSTHLLIKL